MSEFYMNPRVSSGKKFVMIGEFYAGFSSQCFELPSSPVARHHPITRFTHLCRSCWLHYMKIMLS